MSRTTALSLRDWAENVRPARFRFADLDAHLFRGNPRVLYALGRQRQNPDRTADDSTWTPGGVVTALYTLAAFIAPIAGHTSLWTDVQTELGTTFEGFETSTALTIVMVSFWLTVPGFLALAYLWWRQERRWDRSTYGYCAWTAGWAAPTIFLMRLRAAEDGLSWAEAAVPVWLTIGLALALALAQLLFSTGRQTDSPHHLPRLRPPDETAVAAAIARLDEAEVERLKARRREALDLLDERGLISGSQWQSADLKPLGTLYTLDD